MTQLVGDKPVEACCSWAAGQAPPGRSEGGLQGRARQANTCFLNWGTPAQALVLATAFESDFCELTSRRLRQ